MEAFWAPDYGVGQIFATVFDAVTADQAVLLEFLGVAVVDSDGEEANCALGEHVHAMKTVHDLVSDILGEIVVSLHSELVLLQIVLDALGDRQQTLSVLAVRAVERKSLVHRLLLPLYLNGDAFLVELMLGDAQVHIDQQEFIVFDEPIVKGYFVVLQSDLPLLEEKFEVDADQCCFLYFIGLIYVILKDHF